MSKIVITTLVVLAVTTHVTPQYIDFFQGFSSFLQPYQTTRRNDATKRPAHRQTTKPRYQGAIFFDTDEIIKQKSTTSTTVKPRKKPKTTTSRPSTRIVASDDRNVYETTNGYQISVYDTNSHILNNKRTENNNREFNNGDNKRVNGEVDNGNDRRVDQNRRVDETKAYNINNYNYESTSSNYNNRQTTHRPYYNNFGVPQKPQKPVNSNNRRTTINPLLYRPGVKPAVVDDNRPPITNKPVTNWPLNTEKPVSTKPNQFDTNDDSDPDIKIGLDEDEMSESEKRRYYEIAEQKCNEYKSLNTKKLVALPLVGGHGVELNVTTCKPINIPLIIGGKVVTIQEFPHMGLVGWRNLQNDGYSWKCGSSLISEQYLLTAGHCTYHDKDYNVVSGPPHAVQLGSSFLDGPDALVVTISAVIRHPKFKLRRSYYDVALIKLITPVKFSESISPACLGVPPPVGNRIIATGWGRTEFGGDSSHELRSVSVPIWKMEECREVWGTSRKLPDGPSPASQLCAGERTGGKDTCQGDSGGPAQVQDGCTWRVVAVTSVGRSCGAAETPALYAKIPRAFVASQAFANVKLNNKNDNNNRRNDNNRYNENNNNDYNNINGNTNQFNTNGNNEFTTKRVNYNNQDSQFGGSGNDREYVPVNHHNIADNNRGNSNSNTGIRDRPGNHQTIGSNFDIQNTDSQYSTQNYNTQNGAQYSGSNQYSTQNSGYNSNRGENVNRPGNQNDRRKVSNEGIHSNNRNTNREPIVSRPVSYTVDNNRGNTNNRYNQNNRNSGSGQDTVYRPGNDQRVDNQQTSNNNDDIRNTNSWATNSRPEVNGNDQYDYNSHRTTTVNYYNNNRESYNQNQQNNRPTEGYNVGIQNSNYFTTQNPYNANNGYNQNNNGYNNNDFIIANRPWWNR